MNFSREQIDNLLGMAAQKLGTTPEDLRSQLENSTFEEFVGKLGNSQGAGMGSGKLSQLLSNPKAVEQLLSSPQARKFIGQILGSGGMNG